MVHLAVQQRARVTVVGIDIIVLFDTGGAGASDLIAAYSFFFFFSFFSRSHSSSDWFPVLRHQHCGERSCWTSHARGPDETATNFSPNIYYVFFIFIR